MEYGKKTEKKKHGKLQTHHAGPGIWHDTLKNMENETHTLQDLEYGE
jgi:hypothetical protein